MQDSCGLTLPLVKRAGCPCPKLELPVPVQWSFGPEHVAHYAHLFGPGCRRGEHQANGDADESTDSHSGSFRGDGSLEGRQGYAPSIVSPMVLGKVLRLRTADMCPDRESLRDPFELDRAAYGVDRSRLLERLVAAGAGEPLVAGSER